MSTDRIVARKHAEWLSLIEISGPFLSMPVLLESFPQGLDLTDDEGKVRRRVRLAYDGIPSITSTRKTVASRRTSPHCSLVSLKKTSTKRL